MVKKARRIVLVLVVCILLIFAGCAQGADNNGNTRQGEKQQTEDLDSNDDETVDSDGNVDAENNEPEKLNSQFWLPISVMQYDTEGNVLKSIVYQYDEYGFLNYVKGIGVWRGTAEEPEELIFDSTYDEATGTLCLVGMLGGEETKIEYYFDEEDLIMGMKLGDGDVRLINQRTEIYYDEEEGIYKDRYITIDDEIIKGIIDSHLWLDENGEIDMDKLPALSPVYMTEDLYSLEFVNEVIITKDGKYKLKSETDEEGETVVHPNKIYYGNIAMPSVWEYHSEKNSDGTVTTTVCYETGEMGEVIIWIPVTKMGFFQNIYFDWDYSDVVTLLTIFRS